MVNTVDGFAEQRTTMPYRSYSRCVWRIQPPVPAGYTLRLNFDHFDTEQDGPDAPEPPYRKPSPDRSEPQQRLGTGQGYDPVKLYETLTLTRTRTRAVTRALTT
mgnify:CR=1 FL=1